jgi:hypothetical protein
MKNKNNNTHQVRKGSKLVTELYYEVGSYAHLDHSEKAYKVIKNNPPGMIQGVVLALDTLAVAIRTERLKPAVLA